MRSYLITLYVLLSLVHSNVAKRLGEGMTIGDTYVEILDILVVMASTAFLASWKLALLAPQHQSQSNIACLF
jgi:hypothetical protein